MKAHAHPSDKELEMYALERLLPEQASKVEPHLAVCSECAGKLPELVGFALTLRAITRRQESRNGERRREQRIPTDEPGRMRLLSPFSPDTFEIRVLNVSRNGLGVSVPCRLQSETLVQVFCKDSIILGEVCHCILSDAKYQAGIQIQSVVHASGKFRTT